MERKESRVFQSRAEKTVAKKFSSGIIRVKKGESLERGTYMIKFSIRGENLEVTEALRNYVEDKVAKIEKYFHEDQELNAKVNLKVYRDKRAKVEVTIPIGSITLRAEDVSQEMYGSIDLVVDKIERQIRRNKTKIERKHRQKVSTSQIFTEDLVEQAEEEVKVVRTKQVDLKPMDIEEAILQLELLGHDFFIYTDASDGTTNVLYKREDGDLGLLEVRQ